MLTFTLLDPLIGAWHRPCTEHIGNFCSKCLINKVHSGNVDRLLIKAAPSGVAMLLYAVDC